MYNDPYMTPTMTSGALLILVDFYDQSPFRSLRITLYRLLHRVMTIAIETAAFERHAVYMKLPMND